MDSRARPYPIYEEIDQRPIKSTFKEENKMLTDDKIEKNSVTMRDL